MKCSPGFDAPCVVDGSVIPGPALARAPTVAPASSPPTAAAPVPCTSVEAFRNGSLVHDSTVELCADFCKPMASHCNMCAACAGPSHTPCQWVALVIHKSLQLMKPTIACLLRLCHTRCKCKACLFCQAPSPPPPPPAPVCAAHRGVEGGGVCCKLGCGQSRVQCAEAPGTPNLRCSPLCPTHVSNHKRLPDPLSSCIYVLYMYAQYPSLDL